MITNENILQNSELDIYIFFWAWHNWSFCCLLQISHALNSMGEKGELDTEGDGVGGDEYTQLYGEQPDKTYVRQQNDKLIAY